MDLDIHKLIESEYELLTKFGWFLYNRKEQTSGLTNEDVYDLLSIINEDEMEKEYMAAYHEGFNDAVCGK
ncbi:hypothetical protein WKH57_01160 [Niallia taxi]|uniref:hypothetical protein n=1 Tax=Niallia taxi TaxID=2499688 RepID=UPI00317B0446